MELKKIQYLLIKDTEYENNTNIEIEEDPMKRPKIIVKKYKINQEPDILYQNYEDYETNQVKEDGDDINISSKIGSKK